MLHDQIMSEIKQIPESKLPEILDLIHYFRLGVQQEQVLDTHKKPNRVPGSLKRLGQIQNKQFAFPDDFNAPLDDMQEYMQ